MISFPAAKLTLFTQSTKFFPFYFVILHCKSNYHGRNNTLDRLDGLDARFEEVSTLITDPSVIADQKRYVRLSKEYHDLEVIIKAKNEYKSKLDAIAESKEILSMEDDDEMKALAREELDSASAAIPNWRKK